MNRLKPKAVIIGIVMIVTRKISGKIGRIALTKAAPLNVHEVVTRLIV
jgi:hypothetical protein